MSVKGVDEEVMAYFYNNDWPGNVRELQNTIESAMNFVEVDYITITDLQNLSQPCLRDLEERPKESITKDGVSLKEAVEEYEKQIIRIALEEAGQNCAKAARALKVPKQTLHGKVKRYGL